MANIKLKRCHGDNVPDLTCKRYNPYPDPTCKTYHDQNPNTKDIILILILLAKDSWEKDFVLSVEKFQLLVTRIQLSRHLCREPAFHKDLSSLLLAS